MEIVTPERERKFQVIVRIVKDSNPLRDGDLGEIGKLVIWRMCKLKTCLPGDFHGFLAGDRSESPDLSLFCSANIGRRVSGIKIQALTLKYYFRLK
jgi:hypothetical protein